MSKKKKEGLGGSIAGVIISLAMIGVVLAILQILGVASLEGAMTTVKTKATHYAECIPTGSCGIMSVVDNIGNPEGGPISVPSLPNEGLHFEAGEGGLHFDPSGEGLEFNAVTGEDGLSFDVNGEPTLMFNSRETRGYRGPSKGEPYVNNAGLVYKEVASEMLSKLKFVARKDVDKVKFSKREWKHWTNIKDRRCWNIREEILHRDAVPGSLSYVDRSKKPTDYKSACAIGKSVDVDGQLKVDSVDSGKWICPYSGKKITDSEDIEVDHIFSLSNAAKSGGQDWTLEQKEHFANDPDNLLATSTKEKEAKGNKGPGEYMPPLKSYRCNYAKSYTTVAYKYGLTITDSDKEEIDKVLKSCQH